MLVDVGAFLKVMKKQKSKVLEMTYCWLLLAEESGHPKIFSDGKIMSLYTQFERFSEWVKASNAFVPVN